jgi:hypothetical protein
MGVTTTQTNKPLNPRGNDQSPLAYNRAKLFSGKALDFDGVNDYVDCGTLDVTAYTGISMSFNFQLANITDNGLRLVSLLHSGTDDIRIEQGLSVLRITLDDGTSYTLETPSLTANEWNKLDMTFNGTTLEGYINGVSIGSISASFDFSTANGLLNLFKHTAASSYAEGLMAGFKIFNTALTAAQVADLYNNPEKVVPTGVANSALKLWLPMQEGAGTTAYDGSGNGNHGTISGATYVHGIGAPVSQTSVIDWNKGVNSFTYSEDFSNAAWLVIDVTKVSTSETDYIGGTTAANITWLAGNPRYFYQSFGVSGASTLSFYVKSNGGGNKFRLFGNGTLAISSDLTATSEWVRYDFEFTGTSSAGIGIMNATDNSAADLLVCFAQVETNATAGPYTPTFATAQTSPVLLPQGLTTGRDITGVNLFENVRKQGALNLDGNSWAEVHDNASLDLSSEVTFESWIRWAGELDQTILGRWHGSEFARSLILYVNDVDKVSAFYSSTGSTTAGSLVASQTLTAGNWYHVVFTSDGSTIKIYVNAAEGNSASYSGGFYVSDKNLEIGTYQTDENKAYNGPIAQPRIYNRALTAEEVQRNYNAGKNIYS